MQAALQPKAAPVAPPRLAAHVQAATQGSLQRKAVAPAPRPPAAHVQAAVRATVQPKTAPGIPLRPAAHVQTATQGAPQHRAPAQPPVQRRALPKPPLPGPAVQPFRAARPEVIQRIRAFRVQHKDNPKVVVENNRVVRYEIDEEFGINISFGDLSHADKYFRSKLNESSDYVLVEWDFDDELYEMIQGRINKRTERKWTGKPKWEAVTSCQVPVPTSDSWVVDKKNALHLPRSDWIDVLNRYARGGHAQVHDSSYFSDEVAEKEPVVVKNPTDTVVVLDSGGNYAYERQYAEEANLTYIEVAEATRQGLVWEN